MNQNNKGVERWQEIQIKYEESQTIINRQLVIIDDLNKNISSLKDVNNQIEYNWNSKYIEDTGKKDATIAKMEKEFKEFEIEMKQA